MSQLQLAVQFLLQIVVILVAAQGVGAVARRFGQPQVVAEMIAGVLLGPSLLGLFAPDLSAKLFPADSMKVLFPVSQLGLAAYMFVVGLEFRTEIILQRLRSSVAVSIAGMAVPFILGGALGAFLHASQDIFPERTTRFEAVVFLGASLCITAFPMLARIIHHQGLAGTVMGTVALGAGAIDDVAAWCLLALVLASFDGDPAQALHNIFGGVAYVGLTLLVIRPALAWWSQRIESRGHLTDTEFSFALALLAAGAWFTDLIGLHAVFGAFVMGIAMPRGLVSRTLAQRIEPLTVALLLPLFFTYSGLNTRIGLLDSWHLWIIAGAILVAAVAGKGLACWFAARLTGLSHRDGLGIGILMNSRGLMELIIINIGLQRGIISPALFATLVLMAVVTTLMASPLFEWTVRRRSHPAPLANDVPTPAPTPGA